VELADRAFAREERVALGVRLALAGTQPVCLRVDKPPVLAEQVCCHRRDLGVFQDVGRARPHESAGDFYFLERDLAEFHPRVLWPRLRVAAAVGTMMGGRF